MAILWEIMVSSRYLVMFNHRRAVVLSRMSAESGFFLFLFYSRAFSALCDTDARTVPSLVLLCSRPLRGTHAMDGLSAHFFLQTGDFPPYLVETKSTGYTPAVSLGRLDLRILQHFRFKITDLYHAMLGSLINSSGSLS